jgi:hypothetical protein
VYDFCGLESDELIFYKFREGIFMAFLIDYPVLFFSVRGAEDNNGLPF